MKAEQLRKAILQMAIRGKLVPQDPNDEPASVLLEKIRAEKQKLIKEGKIKKDKCDSVIFKGDDNRHYEKVGGKVTDIEDQIPFKIPDSWEWCRFPQLVNFVLGKTPERHNSKYWINPSIPWFSIADMKDKEIVGLTKEKISDFAYDDKFNNCCSPAGTLIMSFKLTVGRTSILGVDAVHNEAIISIFPFIDIDHITRDFLFNLLGIIVEYVPTTDAIKGATLNSDKMKSMLIPIPPLSEQKCIVAEIEKYEPLIAEYDKLETEATALDVTIKDKLKKSILQYAIQGKLVPQDENDEPASVLLERIRAEKKSQLGKKYVDSYIYKGDDNCYYEKIGESVKNITDEIPFEVPDKWVWARLKSIVFNHGQKLPTTKFCYIDIGSIDNCNQKLAKNETVIEANDAPSRARKIVKRGDIIYSTVRPYLHNMCIIDKVYSCEPIASTGFAVLACKDVYNNYLFYCLLSPFFDEYANSNENSKGVAYPAINDDKLYQALIPIPPIEEQQRIVNYVNILLKKMG